MRSLLPAAGRRLDIGLALLAAGAAADAAEAFQAALDLDPDYAAGHFSLGQACEAAGATERAVAAYRRCLDLAPEDVLGAGVRLALLGAAETPARLPEAHVRTLFDQIAPQFDRMLLDRLGYRAPALLRAAVLAARPAAATPPAAGERGLAVLDLGCGTGLAGAAVRDLAQRLEGVDLSPAMIARARARGLYDSLEVAELSAALAVRPGRFDLVLAADVLCYLGDLMPVFADVRAALRPGGLFACTVERAAAPGFHLGAKQRYAHHPDTIAAWAAAAGFAVLSLSPESSRTEAGAPVPGLVAVLHAAAGEASGPGRPRRTRGGGVEGNSLLLFL